VDDVHDAAVEAFALVHAVLTECHGGPPGAVGRDDLLAALTVLRHLRAELVSWEPRLIGAARDQGASWASLAPALGVTSRQAAERRYLRLRPSPTGEPTAEARVQAERSKRAGDRAVTAWARRNSSALRQLAGQISAVEGFTGSAQRSVSVLRQAMADDDPATRLAERVTSVTDQVAELRRRTTAQRD
jgi:hypothetical protein